MKKDKSMDYTFFDINSMASMSEYTGLIPSGITDESEAEAYGELVDINKQKTIK